MYGLIPHEHWSYPPWVTQEDAAAAREKMAHDWVLYGARESYHHMCRYFSGFFYRHPLLADFDYYWRMEPDVHYYCDLDYDPFLYMQVGPMQLDLLCPQAGLLQLQLQLAWSASSSSCDHHLVDEQWRVCKVPSTEECCKKKSAVMQAVSSDRGLPFKSCWASA